ncbi:hypothetical protein V6N00_12815 [Tersicoccus sp. MR15.9]|uniref:5' nucleotidase, NT5C type n=1 Tax=Tersicoccus mangrovi TaxID=3121635 RepID=UPI002FE620B5
MSAPADLSRVVLLDMDETLFRYGPALNRRLLELDPHYPIVADEDRLHYDHLAGPGGSTETLLAAMNSVGLFTDLQPEVGALAAVEEMLADGLNVFLCTSPTIGNPTCMQEKAASIAKHFGPAMVKRTIFTYDKTLVRGAVLVDDKPEITGAMSPVWTQLMFSRPFNRYVTDHPHRLEAWAHWREAVYPLLENAARRLPAA